MYSDYLDLQWKERGRSWEEGVDCWGLVLLFYEKELGFKVEDHLDAYTKVIDPQIDTRINREIHSVWSKVDEPRTGDVVLGLYGKRAMHTGVYVSPNLVLHIERNNSPVFEDLDGIEWKHRLLGYYRHQNLM